MGTKGLSVQRLRRGAFKCEFCGRCLLSSESLRSHQRVVHSAAVKDREKRRVAPRANGSTARPRPAAGKSKTSDKKLTKVVSRIKVKKMPLQSEKTPERELDNIIKSSDERKIEFKCPVCDKMYPVFFSALKHIQKFHCVNSQGEKVEPYSKDIIKPVRTELCILCNERVSCTEIHECAVSARAADRDLNLSYICTGCNQKFVNMKLFDIHIVSGVHSDGIESMFFPTNQEFENWKMQMETQTQSKFLYMGKYEYKQIYRCSHQSTDDADDSSAHFCPSTIIYQEFSKGMQVHFYKFHFGHDHKKYVLPQKYKTYSLTDLLQQGSSYTDMSDVKLDENDMYVQFKKLMESIVLDAAKINIDTLKILVGKALEMTSVLTNYDEDKDFEITENTSTISINSRKDKGSDDQITQALEGLRASRRIKRKSSVVSEIVTPAKRLLRSKSIQNVEDKSPILQKVIPKANTFSLADDKDTQKILNELDGDGGKSKTVTTKSDIEIEKESVTNSTSKIKVVKFNQSPKTSFNDTYKDFVRETAVITKKKTPMQEKDTKMISIQDTKKIPIQENKKMPVQDTKKIPIQEKKKMSIQETKQIPIQENKKTPIQDTKKLPLQNTKKTPIQDTKKTPIQNTKKIPIQNTKKKQVVKTKIGQFKPSISPKVLNNKQTKGPRSSIGKVNEIKYEVEERENDCNILILKI